MKKVKRVIVLIGSNAGILFIIGLIVYSIVCAIFEKKADKGELFKNMGKFRDRKGEYHDLNYYYDEEEDKFIKL